MTATRPPRRGPSRPLLGALALALAGACTTATNEPPAPTAGTQTPPATVQPTRSADAGDAPTIRTTRQSYRQDETIVVLLRNATANDWFAASGRTWCTILEAQRLLDGGHRPEGACVEGAPPGLVKIPARSEQNIELTPGGSNAPLPAGRYRFALDASEGSSTQPVVTIASPEFTIQA